MPVGVGRRFDFQYGGKGFMMQRGEFKGRAWHRTGQSDSPGQRSQTDAKYGVLPDELDRPEVWDDWSGGFGHAYRHMNRAVYHWSEGFDARWPRQLIHAQGLDNFYQQGAASSTNNINGFLDIPSINSGDQSVPGTGAVMLLADRKLAIEMPSQDGATIAASFSATSTLVNWGYRPAVFGSFIYAPNLSGTSFHQVTFAGVASPNAAAMPAAGFAVAGGRLWRYHGPSTKRIYLQSCAAGVDPTATANWSATLPIGNGQYDINDMVSLEDQLFIGMPDGLYAGDQSGSFYNVLGQVGYQRHVDNGRNLAVYQNGVLYPHQGGLYYYQQQDYSAMVREVGPNLTSNRSPIRGIITAMATRGPWVYAGLWNGSTSYLMIGRETDPNGPFTWYPQARIRDDMYANVMDQRISRLHIDGITVGSGGSKKTVSLLWIGMDSTPSTSNPLFYAVPLPANDTNPVYSDPNFGYLPQTVTGLAFMGSARIDLGVVDNEAPGTSKVYRSVEVWANNLVSGNVWCDVYYDIDTTGSFKLLGTVAKSPKDTLYFSSGEGSFLTGQSMELSIQSFTITQSVTPIYRAFVLRSSLQPHSIDMITSVVRIADGLRDRQGGEMRKGATMLQELRDFSNPDVNGGPHQLIDLAGATCYAKVIPPIEEQEVYQLGDDNPEIAATVRFAVLSFSAN